MTAEKPVKASTIELEQEQESHVVTFFVGFFSGSFVMLFSTFGILAHLSGIFTSGRQAADYIQTVYPVFSFFSLLSLHLFMYGCNIFMWKSTGIDHNSIFEFQTSTALKCKDVFLICTSMMTLVIGALVIHLILVSDEFSFSSHPVYGIPVILFLALITVLICPFNIFYRPTRFCFLKRILHVLCSPFCKVRMVDFFMADQLTSQIHLLRNMERTICYFIAAVSKADQYNTCRSSILYRELSYMLSFVPFCWRAMQCARRWFDEHDVYHLANMGKYMSAMVAAWGRLAYARQEESVLWMVIVIATSLMASMYQLYWDYVEDWGLFHPNAQNPLLRNDLLLKKKRFYYMAIALNLVLRVAWVESVLQFNVGLFSSMLLDFLFASLEVIRRGLWNYFRLENEHLKNVDFKVPKNVPLPSPW